MSGTDIKGLIRRPKELATTPLHKAVFELQKLHDWDDKQIADVLKMGRTHYCSFKYGKRELALPAIRQLYRYHIPADLLLLK